MRWINTRKCKKSKKLTKKKQQNIKKTKKKMLHYLYTCIYSNWIFGYKDTNHQKAHNMEISRKPTKKLQNYKKTKNWLQWRCCATCKYVNTPNWISGYKGTNYQKVHNKNQENLQKKQQNYKKTKKIGGAEDAVPPVNMYILPTEYLAIRIQTMWKSTTWKYQENP